MAYQRDEYRYGNMDRWRDRDRGDRDRGDWGERGYGRARSQSGAGRGDWDRRPGYEEDRGFFNRAGDEVRSWFGDEEAERRREMDQRRYERERAGDWRGGGWRDEDERYGRGAYGGGSTYGRHDWTESDYGGGFGGRRFDRIDAGSTGTHGVHPVASPFGDPYGPDGGATGWTPGYRSSAREGVAAYGAGGFEGRGRPYDRDYEEWRTRQLDELDRDYDDYRRENQSRFEQEFGTWREKRRGQRQSLGRVTEHMEVIGSDGQHIGTVDKVRGDRIILTKSDENAGGHHHSIPCGWIDKVEDRVTINKTAEEAMRSWRDEETRRALFEREDQGSEGPYALGRSFSGTY